MSITTKVPSDRFDDLQRDVQDLSKFVNGAAAFLNRSGREITPISLLEDGIRRGTILKRVCPVSCIKELSATILQDGQQYKVASFYADLNRGGGLFVYKETLSAIEHNGGTVIALNAIQEWDGTPESIADFLSWIGEGVGCFVKIGVSKINPEELGALFDGVSDDTHSLEAANLIARDSCGFLELPLGVSICSFFNFYTGVNYYGVGIGQKTGGPGTTLKMKPGTNPSTGFAMKGTPNASGYIVENICFDGNKQHNSTGHVIYLYQSHDGGALGGDRDDYSVFRNVWVKNGPVDNIHIDGDGSVNGAYYNVRALRVYSVVSVDANRYGWYARRFTDSDIDGVTIYGCKIGAMLWEFCANHLLKKVKGFYNGQSAAINSESFKFISLRRSHIEIEAQEEYRAGILLELCETLSADLFADACGFPSGSAVWGVQLKNTDTSNIRIKADSFHASDTVPFLQNQPLYLNYTNNVKGLQIYLNHQNQATAPFYSMGNVDVSSMMLIENGHMQISSSTIGSAGGAQLSISRRAGDSSKTDIYHIKGALESDNFYIDVKGINSSPKTVNLFRNTNTSASTNLTIFQADGSSTAQHRFNANGSKNAELCLTGGGWNNGHLSLGGYRLWIDSLGRLRMKASAPTSDTDGTIVGTQS